MYLSEAEEIIAYVVCIAIVIGFGVSTYMEIKNIGTMTSEQTQKISEAACVLAQEHLGVSPERTYLEFNDAQRHLWGWNSKNFA